MAWKKISQADRAWLKKVGRCEAPAGYRTNTGNGYYGRYQFGRKDWLRAGGKTRFAHLASRKEQDVIALRWRARNGRSSWPTCGG